MGLATYTELQASVADWLNRADLAAQIPDFITLAEAEFARRVRRRTRRATVQLATAVRPLPLDCAELRSVRLVTSSAYLDVPIEVVTSEMLAEHRAALSATGRPRYAAIVGGELLVAPTPDQSYSAELTYYEALQPLSDSVQTNSLLAEAPDLYLFGALAQAAPFLQHDERIPVWESRVAKAISQLDAQREREEFAASIRPARLRNPI